MKLWLNFIGYELVWFCAVIFAGAGLAWPGVLAMLIFATWQCAVSRARKSDLRLIAMAIGLGLLIDGVMGARGVAVYAAAWPITALAPAWILALWASLALTLNHSLRYLQGRPGLAAVLGAVGGPLAYLGARQGWQAVTFASPGWHALLYLSVAWALALWVLTRVAHHWQEKADEALLTTAGDAR